jgi:predicted dinucleotide-binding enzyme
MKLTELLEERKKIDAKIEQAVQAERKEAKSKVRELCMQYGFTSHDLKGCLKKTAKDIKMEELYAPIAEKEKAEREAKKAKK